MPQTAIVRKTVQIDATGQSIGRLASAIARLLQGKHKATYEAHRDHGDNVEIRNLANLRITGNKMDQKVFYHYSGYPGGMKERLLKDVLKKDPAEAVKHAVYRMLPKNRQRKERMKRLKFVA